MGAIKPTELPKYTYADYQHWEGDWELIAGIPYAMAPAPVKIHQLLVGYLFREFSEHLDACPVCEVLLDEDWKLDDETILKPDIAIVCKDDNPTYISKTPEIVVEVISPSTARNDEGLKYRIYQETGVRYYVITYPNQLLAKVFELKDGNYCLAAECKNDIFFFEQITCPSEIDFTNVFKRFHQ